MASSSARARLELIIQELRNLSSRNSSSRNLFLDFPTFWKHPARELHLELELCVREHGIRELDFFDSSFTIRKDRVLAICQGIVDRKLDIIWSAVEIQLVRSLGRLVFAVF